MSVSTSFRVSGLDPAIFQHLYGRDDAALAAAGARRYRVDKSPGFPDRVELRDLDPGETAILVNYTHQPADTPYRASHAVFVREGATAAWSARDMIPESMRSRTISLRAFDQTGDMIGAEVIEGTEIEEAIGRLLADPAAAYLHAHYAAHGCYAARIDRG